jgi:uncharacterized membrane protein
MPKKLTIPGALMALVIGVLGVFHSSGASATPIQTFSKVDIDWNACYGGAAPSGGDFACGAGSTDDGSIALAANTVVTHWSMVRQPQGSRLTLPFTFTPNGPGMWQEDTAGEIATCIAVDGNGTCGNHDLASSINGDVTAQTDLLCDSGATGVLPDVLATSASTAGLQWPATNFVPFDFHRAAASVALGGGGTPVAPSPYAYLGQISPQPHGATPNAWTFKSVDFASLTQLWLYGTGAYPLPNPSSLALSRYESGVSHSASLDVTVALLGGDPKTPPTNDYLCLDSPQNSIARISYLKTPAVAGIYPRWTGYTSAADFRDGSMDRVLDLQCVDIGSSLASNGGTLVDADADCLASVASGGTDANDGNSDQDSDGVPDGMEVASGSSVTAADADADGSTDFQEIFEFTNPTVADTDGDGSKDKRDTGADEDLPVSGPTVLDSTNDDNCPAFANAGQENSDSGFKENIKLPSSILNPGGTTRLSNGAGGDTTNPNEDTLGDACDADDDNDGLPDVTETSMDIVTVGTVPFGKCKADGLGAPPAVTMGTTNPDSDGDLGLDGRECQMTTRPDDPSAAERMPAGNATVDPDKDQLFAPGFATSAGNLQAEVQYRTLHINEAGDRGTSTAAGATTLTDASKTWAVNEWQGGTVVAISATFSPPSVPTPAANSCRGVISSNTGSVLTVVVWVDRTSTLAVPPGPLPCTPTAVTDYFIIGTGTDNPDGDGSGLPGDADDDSDNDGIKDGVEVRFYGTDPNNSDSDGDGCTDGMESGDVNGDRSVTAADMGAISNSGFPNPVGPVGIFGNYRNASVNQYTTGAIGVVASHRVNYDFDKNGAVGASDLGAVAPLVGKNCGNAPLTVVFDCDPAVGVQTCANQKGRVVGQQTKLPTDP